MRHCPKCLLTFSDLSRICRSCGAILDEGPSGPEALGPGEAVAAALSEFPDSSNESHSHNLDCPEAGWICPGCDEFVPDTFDVCWNCNRLRPEAAELTAPPQTDEKIEGIALPKTPQPRLVHCTACGSAKIIPDTRIVDQGQHSDGSLCVVIYGEPEALIFKDRLSGKLKADICGECGHVQMRVHNPAELYAHYCKSQRIMPPPTRS